jgi:predicted GTPase
MTESPMKMGYGVVRADAGMGDAKAASSALTSVSAELSQEGSSAIRTLEALAVHRESLGEPATAAVAAVVGEIKRRLARDELYVCIVGEMKAGKSTLLNALLGERVLGTAVRECTGTVTLIRRAAKPNYRARFLDGGSEEFADIFRSREEGLKADQAEAERRYQACLETAKSLPRQETAAASAVTEHEEALTALKPERREKELAEGAIRAQLAEAQAACDAFQADVQEQGQAIPSFYRFLAQRAGTKVPRLLSQKLHRPDWEAHLEQVHALDAQRAAVRSIAAQAEEAGRLVADVDRRLEHHTTALASARAWVRELRQLRIEIPGKTVQWEAEIERLAGDWAVYVRERQQRFLDEVRRLTDMTARGGEVIQLELDYPARFLPPGLIVIDTPGVNTDHETNRERAWEVIRREADGCILLSDMQQAVSASTKDFVRQVREVVPHLILMLTKVDRALANAEAGDGPAWEQVEEARRNGERRFAQEVGRDPAEVLSFAVSAERALAGDDAEHGRYFEEAVNRLLDVLLREKALMLAARSARAISRCVTDITEAQQRAELSYRDRIAALQAQRIPDPQKFCRDQMDRVKGDIKKKAIATLRAGIASFDEQMAELKKRCIGEVLACANAGNLKLYVQGIESTLGKRFRALEKAVQERVREDAGAAVREIELPLLEELRNRYRITRGLAGGAGKRVDGGSVEVQDGTAVGVGVDLKGSFGEFEAERGGLFAGGAAAGAVIGSIIPVVGTIFGALIGGTLAWMFGPGLDKVKQECTEKLVAGLDEAESQMRQRLVTSGGALLASMRQALASVLNESTQRYSGWIAGLIRDEQRRIGEEKEKLAHLVLLRAELEAHNERLANLVRLAADESKGLCR